MGGRVNGEGGNGSNGPLNPPPNISRVLTTGVLAVMGLSMRTSRRRRCSPDLSLGLSEVVEDFEAKNR